MPWRAAPTRLLRTNGRKSGALDHALNTLRAQSYPVLDADAARLSVYQWHHINVHGHYSFALPDRGGGRRPLRDPDTEQE